MQPCLPSAQWVSAPGPVKPEAGPGSPCHRIRKTQLTLPSGSPRLAPKTASLLESEQKVIGPHKDEASRLISAQHLGVEPSQQPSTLSCSSRPEAYGTGDGCVKPTAALGDTEWLNQKTHRSDPAAELRRAVMDITVIGGGARSVHG